MTIISSQTLSLQPSVDLVRRRLLDRRRLRTNARNQGVRFPRQECERLMIVFGERAPAMARLRRRGPEAFRGRGILGKAFGR